MSEIVRPEFYFPASTYITGHPDQSNNQNLFDSMCTSIDLHRKYYKESELPYTSWGWRKET